MAAESVQSRLAAGAAASPFIISSSRSLAVRARLVTNPLMVRWPPRSIVVERTRFHPQLHRSPRRSPHPSPHPSLHPSPRPLTSPRPRPRLYRSPHPDSKKLLGLGHSAAAGRRGRRSVAPDGRSGAQTTPKIVRTSDRFRKKAPLRRTASQEPTTKTTDGCWLLVWRHQASKYFVAADVGVFFCGCPSVKEMKKMATVRFGKKK